MGMDQTVSLAGGAVPTWSSVAERLGQGGFAVQLRMIDGELAFSALLTEVVRPAQFYLSQNTEQTLGT